MGMLVTVGGIRAAGTNDAKAQPAAVAVTAETRWKTADAKVAMCRKAIETFSLDGTCDDAAFTAKQALYRDRVAKVKAAALVGAESTADWQVEAGKVLLIPHAAICVTNVTVHGVGAVSFKLKEGWNQYTAPITVPAKVATARADFNWASKQEGIVSVCGITLK